MRTEGRAASRKVRAFSFRTRPEGLLKTWSGPVEPVMCGGGAGVGVRSLAILFKVG